MGTLRTEWLDQCQVAGKLWSQILIPGLYLWSHTSVHDQDHHSGGLEETSGTSLSLTIVETF